MSSVRPRRSLKRFFSKNSSKNKKEKNVADLTVHSTVHSTDSFCNYAKNSSDSSDFTVDIDSNKDDVVSCSPVIAKESMSTPSFHGKETRPIFILKSDETDAPQDEGKSDEDDTRHAPTKIEALRTLKQGQDQQEKEKQQQQQQLQQQKQQKQLKQQQRLADAARVEVLQIQLNLLGPDHPDVLFAMKRFKRMHNKFG